MAINTVKYTTDGGVTWQVGNVDAGQDINVRRSDGSWVPIKPRDLVDVPQLQKVFSQEKVIDPETASTLAEILEMNKRQYSTIDRLQQALIKVQNIVTEALS